MDKTIFFDMDGTFVGLYLVENWLDYLLSENPYPYIMAKPLIHLATFARMLHELQRKGYKIGIISWLSRDASPEYDELVTVAKKAWLRKHLPSVTFDTIHIVPYGTPKENYANPADILFDDEVRNRENWTGTAFNASAIIDTLKEIMKEG